MNKVTAGLVSAVVGGGLAVVVALGANAALSQSSIPADSAFNGLTEENSLLGLSEYGAR